MFIVINAILIRSSSGAKHRVATRGQFKRHIALLTELLSLNESRSINIGLQTSSKTIAINSSLCRVSTYVPGCTYGTFANSLRSAPRGSFSRCDGTSNTIVSRRAIVYFFQSGMCLLLGLPVRARAMNVSLI